MQGTDLGSNRLSQDLSRYSHWLVASCSVVECYVAHCEIEGLVLSLYVRFPWLVLTVSPFSGSQSLLP